MEAIGGRLRLLLRPLTSSPSSRIQLQARNLFSSFSGEPGRRSRPLSDDDSDERGAGSLVYRHALKTQHPSTIRWRKELRNSASFIGRVGSPVKTFTTRDGYLGSFTKACDNGNIVLRHKLIVKEINYVANNNQTTSKNIEDPQESPLEKHRKRLHMWQVFFASPHEWKDLRKRKTNPRQPDFKHKGTGEALWLNPSDPPWVMRQLQLQDSRMGGMYLGEHPSYRSSLSPMSYESD